jgi:hypothetical protein
VSHPAVTETYLLMKMKCGIGVESSDEFDNHLQCNWQISHWAAVYLLIPAHSIGICYDVGEWQFSTSENIFDYLT